jgi:hypothetical protein
MAGQSSSHQGIQELEREREKERERETPVLADFLLFSPFIPLGPTVYGMVLPTFRMGFPPLVNFLWKCTHRYTQRWAALIF